MRDIEEFLKHQPLEAPPDALDSRMARLFATPPADTRWWRRPIALWQGAAAATLVGLACYGAGRYLAAPTENDAVAKETVYYIIQETTPGTRNAFDVPTTQPGQEWWRQTARPEQDGDAI